VQLFRETVERLGSKGHSGPKPAGSSPKSPSWGASRISAEIYCSALYTVLTRHIRPAGAETAGNLPKSARKAPSYRKNPQRSGMHPSLPLSPVRRGLEALAPCGGLAAQPPKRINGLPTGSYGQSAPNTSVPPSGIRSPVEGTFSAPALALYPYILVHPALRLSL
jgi:hypothetical protein